MKTTYFFATSKECDAYKIKNRYLKCLTTLLMHMRFKTVKGDDDCSASIDCGKSEFKIIFQF